MRFYGLSFKDIHALPIIAFWALNGLINRVRAEEILDWLPAHASAMGGEGVKNLADSLEERIGKPIIFEQEKMKDADANALKRHFG